MGSVALGRLPQPLRPAPQALRSEAALAGGRRRLRRPPRPLRLQAVPNRSRESLQRELPVPPLAPLVLRHGADDRADPVAQALLLRVGERRGGLDVEDRLDAGLRLLRVLPTGPARAGDAEL